MAKNYIELRFKKRTYKLQAEEVGRMFRIKKRKTPAIPLFGPDLKEFLETDSDNEVKNSLSN